MQSTEKVNQKKKILNYERAPGICDSENPKIWDFAICSVDKVMLNVDA